MPNLWDGLPDKSDVWTGLPDQADPWGNLPDKKLPNRPIFSLNVNSPEFQNMPTAPPEPKAPQSTPNWMLEQTARIGLPIAGGFIGALGGPPGVAAGGMIGGGLGNILGNEVSGKDFNNKEFALDTLLGGIPSVLPEAKLAEEGTSAYLKYLAKQAGRGAVEGAAISAGSTPFQHEAQTGSYNAPVSDYLSNAISGLGFGAVLGGGLSALHGRPEITPRSAEPPPDFTKQPTMADMAPPGMPPSVQPPPPNAFERAMRAKGATTPEDMAPGPMGEHEVAATDQIPVPKQNVNPQFIEKMAQGGYTESHRDNNFVYFQQGPEEPAFQRVVPPNSGEQSELKDSRRSPLSPDQYNDPTAKRWAAIVHELDSQNARDMDYSEILSTSTKNRLRKGETWRSRVVDGIDYLENLHKEFNPSLEIPSDEPSFQKSIVDRLRDSLNLRQQLKDTMAGTPPAEQPQMMPPEQAPIIPEQMPIEGQRTKGLKIQADITRMAKNITRDYTSPLEAIMVREGVQNGMDAADKLGMNGRVHVRIKDESGSNPGTIEIYDNGAGLDEKALDEKLATLFATGKEGEAGATGGKGIGSASYMLGGDRFTIDTVAVDSIDGKKYHIISEGTPEELLSGESSWSKNQVADSTPTGTKIRIQTTSEQMMGNSRDMANDIASHSRNRPSKLIIDQYGINNGDIAKLHESTSPHVTQNDIASTKNDKVIGDFTTKNSDVKIQIPKFNPTEERSGFNVHYLNNGMFQFSEHYSLPKVMDGVPAHVVVDIHPLVDDLHPDYPFINTREDVKKDIRETITKYIKENIAGPAIERRKNRVQELYDSMTHVSIPGMNRKTVIFDPGNRLTPKEMTQFARNPTTQALLSHYDDLIHQIIESTGRAKWVDRLEGVGLVLDPNMNGVHIPNPTTGKSTILINPFARMSMGESAADNAFKNTITNLHEVAHIGHESGDPIQLTPEDLADPRVGEFFQSYLDQVIRHGDVGFQNTGHGMGFTHRLGEVYAKFGVEKTYDAADRFKQLVTDQSGGYSPEVQRLLHLYTESRGRDATTEDLLSGTGVKQANTGSEGEGSVPGTNPADGDGTNTKKGFFRGTLGWGQGATKGGSRTQKDEVNWVREALSVPAAATTTGDLSYPGRQGLSMIFTPQFWDAAGKMFKGGLSQKTFDQMNADLANKPLMRKRVNLKTGQVSESLGQELGLKIYKLASQAGPHAEGISSRWLERGIGKTTKDAEGNKFWQPTAGSKAWANTVGVPIRASNRAFLTMMNHLSVNRTEFLMNKARDMSVGALKTGEARPGIFKQQYGQQEAMDLNPYHNKVLAKEIVDFVNTATGHAPLKMHILPAKQTELSLEGASKALSSVLFSPGQLFSRMRMMNPSTYIMASPYVRKQYLKSALSTAAAWYAFTEMAKMAGGDKVQVSNDPTSADFGKVRIGDARLDPGGGFLQFLVAYGRLYAGGATSSSTGQFHRFGEGYQAQTSEDMMQRFMVNKLNPNAKFAYDLLSASQYNPFHVGDRTAQMFVPLIAQDLLEIGREDPTLLPTMGTAATFGMGTQIYSKGESVGKIIPPENDWLVTGGGVRDLWGGGNQ